MQCEMIAFCMGVLVHKPVWALITLSSRIVVNRHQTINIFLLKLFMILYINYHQAD